MYFNYLFFFKFLLLWSSIESTNKIKNKAEESTELIQKIIDLNHHSNLEQLLIDILYPRISTIKCFAILCDDMYCNTFTSKIFKRFKVYSSYYMINIPDSEDLFAPSNETQESLEEVKSQGCKFYIILLANGLQVSRFLQFGDRYRVINTRSNFIMFYDMRLFQQHLHYLWTRIVNVIFIREYGGVSTQTSKSSIPWFDLSTVPFPSPIREIFIPHRLDSWRKGHFRAGVDLFRDKTSDLKSQVLKVITFQHIPAVAKSIATESNSTAINTAPIVYSGLEVEILQTLAEQMNFLTSIYELENADVEKWGKLQNGKFTGLLGEMVKFKAEIALGDLHYSPYHLELMDLTTPYNTECLTFLTPESSKDNAWKTLILPFKLYMWLTVILVIFLLGFIFHFLARWHQYLYESAKESSCIVFESNLSAEATQYPEILQSPSKKIQVQKRNIQVVENEKKTEGLWIFLDYFNTFMYTYCMMLQISLPKVPDGWSLRMLVGWYFLYTLMVVVSYKASMTSILANPSPKITIDNLEQLYESHLACGGWSETAKEFFLTSLDPAGQKIGEIFEHVNDSDLAVEKVASGEFAYYENIYYLKAISVKRELMMQIQRAQQHTEDTDRNLHIMTDCVINMPISIGLQKNSPIKTKIDTFIRRIIEGGFVKKWLNDVMQPTLTSEMHIEPEVANELMTLRKLYAGIGALFIGYFLSIITLCIELGYWQFVVKKNPFFDKYSNTIYVPIKKPPVAQNL